MNNFTEKTAFFRKNILNWAAANPRPMPWKGVKDPYLVWLSEIILQQTRVEQGRSYYERISTACPDVFSLASLPEDQLMKLWEGLGYYSRARNLQAAAQTIAYDYDGKFPKTYKEILQLKGVGPYTAAAIASFAFDLPHAVVDGNVFRVLSRFFGIETPIDSPLGKREFDVIAATCLAKSTPAHYNQAIMDFGAMQCTPRKPHCSNCPLKKKCVAFGKNLIEVLPVKDKKLIKTTRFFHYFFLLEDEHTWIGKRTGKDIWKHLYEFPMIEVNFENASAAELLGQLQQKLNSEIYLDTTGLETSDPYKWNLTHQTIQVSFHIAPIVKGSLSIDPTFNQIKLTELKSYAFPKVIDGYLREKNYL